MKIYNDLTSSITTSQLPTMPMEILKLLAAPNNEDIIDALKTLYQQNIGTLLFTAITT